jgi:hypothetical protein
MEPIAGTRISVSDAEKAVRDHLDKLGDQRVTLRRLLEGASKRLRGDSSPPADPVRTKNLQKCAGYLNRIAQKGETTLERSSPLGIHLSQLARPSSLTSDSAWELADALEAELILRSDATELRPQLQELSGTPASARVFSDEYVKKLLDGLDGAATARAGTDAAVEEARHALLRSHDAMVAEYRRDRAKLRLRGAYLHKMAWFLFVMLVAFCLTYLAAQGAEFEPEGGLRSGYLRYWLLLAALAGATGSVLSRAIQIGKQPLHDDPVSPSHEPPLGIRALLSGWKVFLAQPVLGATAAVIVFLIFYGKLVQIGGLTLDSVEAYAVLAFLTGFSEPFFLGILDKISKRETS